jgi:hypothetical protein
MDSVQQPSRFAWVELGVALPKARTFPYLIPIFWGALGTSYKDLLMELSRGKRALP